MSKAQWYLLDVNVLVLLLDEDHIHHQPATEWFDTPVLQWAVCPFTEAGFLRYMIRLKAGDMNMEEAIAMLAQLAQGRGITTNQSFPTGIRCAAPSSSGYSATIRLRMPTCSVWLCAGRWYS